MSDETKLLAEARADMVRGIAFVAILAAFTHWVLG